MRKAKPTVTNNHRKPKATSRSVVAGTSRAYCSPQLSPPPGMTLRHRSVVLGRALTYQSIALALSFCVRYTLTVWYLPCHRVKNSLAVLANFLGLMALMALRLLGKPRCPVTVIAPNAVRDVSVVCMQSAGGRGGDAAPALAPGQLRLLQNPRGLPVPLPRHRGAAV